MSIGINLRMKPIINVAFRRSLDPPKSPLLRGTLRNTLVPPLLRGTLRNTLVPPLLRGVRGDLDFDTNKKDYRFDIMRTLALTTNQVL